MDRVQSHSMAVLIAACVIAFGSLSLTARAQEREDAAPATPEIVRIPDLAKYDCKAVASTGPMVSHHIGQVIKGAYFEWHQIHRAEADNTSLLCISLKVPDARMLSVDQARQFLLDSAAVGVPNENAERTASLNPQPDPYAGVELTPEPLKRAIMPTPDELSRERATNVQPLLPAEKRIDGLTTKTLAPDTPDAQRENANRAKEALPYINDPSALSKAIERPQAYGTDDRTRVTSTSFPWNTVGYLAVTFANGGNYRCSGVIVSPYVFITAGHCIHNRNRGGDGFVTQATVYPGQNQAAFGGTTTRPNGQNSSLRWIRTTTRWTELSGPDSHPITNYGYDLAALQFSTAFTYTSTFMPISYGDTSTGVVNSAGYPATVQSTANNFGMWSMAGEETDTSVSALRRLNVREFEIDTSGGNSGGPYWILTSSGQRYLVGIVSYGSVPDDQGGGPWYNSFNQSLMSTWTSWTPTSDTTPTPAAISVAGLRVPAIFGTPQGTSQSFMRFYNPSTAAGTVTITLANAITGVALATWTSASVPPNGSLQYFIKDIEDQASPALAARQLYYSLSVRPNFEGYFQHVLYKPSDGTLTNLTACDATITNESKTLINVHSSILDSGFPSRIIVHNIGSAATTVQLGIYNATTGARMGGYITPSIPANGEDIRTVTSIEQGAGISPGSSIYHYVIKAETSFEGFLQHLVNNSRNGVITDMTPICKMRRAAS